MSTKNDDHRGAVAGPVERPVRPLEPERAWLVEWRFNGIQWMYLWPRAPGGFSFTSDANQAIRFARREDAEAALKWAQDTDSRRGAGRVAGELLATEHEWPNAIYTTL